MPREKKKTSAVTSEKQPSLSITLGRVIKPSPNDWQFTILQREGLKIQSNVLMFRDFFFRDVKRKNVLFFFYFAKFVFVCVFQTKKTYEQKCRDKEDAEQALNRNATTSNTKQQEKVCNDTNKTDLIAVS